MMDKTNFEETLFYIKFPVRLFSSLRFSTTICPYLGSNGSLKGGHP